MPAPRIFVSHSHQDNQWCWCFVQTLQQAGYDIWYDEVGLGGGAQWVATIEHELQSREIFIVILSPDAMASQWVQKEIQLAQVTGRQIVPVLHKVVRRGYAIYY